MKREGRQHGMVQVYQILPNPLSQRHETRLAHRLLGTPSTAGLFTRVSAKPTNHSKFTGKCCSGKPRCKGCHLSPACKAKNKTKGSRKNMSNDAVSNGRLTLSGNSATTALDQLASYYDHHDYHDDHEDEELEEMSFCEADFESDQVEGDDAWCLVGEM